MHVQSAEAEGGGGRRVTTRTTAKTNKRMGVRPARRENHGIFVGVAQLRADGAQFIGPEEGWLSCRQKGAGRMSEPEAIQAAAEALLT